MENDVTTHKEALKLALEEIKRVKEICLREVGIGLCNEVVIDKIEEALAQPEHEPYAWEFAGTIFHDRKEVFDWYERGDISDIPPLALYTSPPQRKPLTDEQITHLWAHILEPSLRRALNVFARAIEAAHGIK